MKTPTWDSEGRAVVEQDGIRYRITITHIYGYGTIADIESRDPKTTTRYEPTYVTVQRPHGRADLAMAGAIDWILGQ